MWTVVSIRLGWGPVAVLLGLTVASCVGAWWLLGAWCDRSFIRWDGSRLVIREGFRTHAVGVSEALRLEHRRVSVNRRFSEYLWILDPAGVIVKLHPRMWPTPGLSDFLQKVGLEYDPASQVQEVTASRLRRENRQLIPFWMAHPVVLTLATWLIGIFVAGLVLG
jgi:hypothetical protein